MSRTFRASENWESKRHPRGRGKEPGSVVCMRYCTRKSLIPANARVLFQLPPLVSLAVVVVVGAYMFLNVQYNPKRQFSSQSRRGVDFYFFYFL